MKSIQTLRPYIISLIAFVLLNYSVYLFFDADTAVRITDFVGYEDGIVEYMTFFSFLFASVIFVRAFLIKRNIFFLLLALILFMGAGEEISWGQRIFNFSTPESIEEINVQKEFNIHNIGIFNTYDPETNGKKSGLEKLITIGFLYKLFWLIYCIILPIVVMFSDKISSFVNKIRLPVPPFSIGIFFLISWAFFKIIMKYLLVPGQIPVYYYVVGEMEESISAFIFLVLSIYFYNTTKASIET